jgi:hypothetical protein
MRNPYGRGKLQDRPTPSTTHHYRRPLSEVLFGSELRITFLVGLAVLFVVMWFSRPCYLGDCYENHKFMRELLIDAHGKVLDLAIVGIIVLWLNQRLKQRLDAIEYQDQIDSLRGWKDSEAGIRILHNVRRLNRNGITSIFLSDAVFDGLDLRGDGESWASKENANLSGSYAPHSSFRGAILSGISVKGADFQQANFTNAYCAWVDFSECDLVGADFTNAVLTGANFLGARFLRAEQLLKAKNLHQVKLDDQLREEVFALNPKLFDREPMESNIGEFLAMFDPRQLVEEFRKASRPRSDASKGSDR